MSLGELSAGGIYGVPQSFEDRVTALEDTYVKASWFEQVNSGTTGTVTLPAGATIVLDEWAGGVDALASAMSGGIPTYISPTTSLLVKITATLDGSGNYTLSGTPSAYPVAVVYVYKVSLKDLDITKVLGGVEIITPGVVDTPVDGDTLSAISANWAFDHNARDATASVQGHATAAQITKLDGIEAQAVALATVKADSDVASAISLKHTQNTDTILDDGGANEISVTELIRKATADITYYVATDGNDTTGDGTTGLPFATVQHAIDLLPKYLDDYYIAILLKDGTYNQGDIDISGFIGGWIDIYSASWNRDLVTIAAPIDKASVFTIAYNTSFIYLDGISLKIQKDTGACVDCFNNTNIQIYYAKIGDNGNTGTYGVKSWRSIICLDDVIDIDANKVSTGILASWGSLIILYNTPPFGDTFTNVTYAGVITDGIKLVKADYDDAITKKHTQGTDQGLDTGGANAVVVADVKDAITKKHTQNTDTDLDPTFEATFEKVANKDATGGYAGLTLFKINFKNALNTITSFFTNAATVARTYTFPDKDITVAGVADIAVDSNLSVAAQDAISKKHAQGTDTALGAVGTKNPPIDADKAIYRDSTTGDALVTSTWTQIKAFLKTYFDTVYNAITNLTFTVLSIGFSIAGGTTSKTLTVDETVAMSSKAPKESPSFTGNVGIGTTAPTAKLHIGSLGSIADKTYNANTLGEGILMNFYENSTDNTRYADIAALGYKNDSVGGSTMRFFTNPVNSYDAVARMVIDRTGNVGIGTTPTYQLQLSTDSAGKPSTNTWTIVSDERLKKDIQLANLDRCYEIIKTLPLKRFTWKDDVYTTEQVRDRSKLGWISQDVATLFPKAVDVKKFEKVPVEDGVEEYEEQDFEMETIKEKVIEVQDGIPTQIERMVERKKPLFKDVVVVNETGKPVLGKDGKPLTYPVPIMVKKTRPKTKVETIEDCLDLNVDQVYAALYGAVQMLIEKVEALEVKVC